MFDFEQKRRIRRFIYSKPVLVVLLTISALLLNSVVDLYGKERETAHNEAQRAQDLSLLQTRLNELSSQTAALSTDRGVEQEIREKYDVARPGEQVIVLTGSTTEGTATTTPAKGSWWDWLTSWF